MPDDPDAPGRPVAAPRDRTGAGDPCAAMLAAGLATGVQWPDIPGEAVALEAVAVLAVPRSAARDRAAGVSRRFRTAAVSVEEAHAAHAH
ncbi:hypothetical protein AB0903_03295 [Streptomyces sp. NPDC048389]|uniref:hypothetical protein n=1 Tax=Streptomyces sp. NPDC048389 TaxID=3154622 RepID=UPI003454C080